MRSLAPTFLLNPRPRTQKDLVALRATAHEFWHQRSISHTLRVARKRSRSTSCRHRPSEARRDRQRSKFTCLGPTSRTPKSQTPRAQLLRCSQMSSGDPWKLCHYSLVHSTRRVAQITMMRVGTDAYLTYHRPLGGSLLSVEQTD